MNRTGIAAFALALVAVAAVLAPVTAHHEPGHNGGPQNPPAPGEGNETQGADNRSEEAQNQSKSAGNRSEGADQHAGNRVDNASDRSARSTGPPAHARVHDEPWGFHSERARGPVVRFDTQNATSRVDEPGADPITAQIEAVLEYRDENQNGAFDLGEAVVQRMRLAELGSDVINGTSEGDRHAVYILGDGGFLTLVFHTRGLDADAAAKFDVVLQDFPFQENDTRVAVASQVHAEGGVRFSHAAGSPAVVARAGERVGFLSWVADATVDGQGVDVGWSVHTSVSQGDQSAWAYWSYPRGENIVHDPVLGVMSVTVSSLGDPTAFVVAALAGTALLAVGFEARRRFMP